MKAAISPGLIPIWKKQTVHVFEAYKLKVIPDSTLFGSTVKQLNRESYNDIVQIVIQQVW